MSDMKDHDPDEGEWMTPFDLVVGKIKLEAPPTIIDLSWLYEQDDNPNIVRGYN